MPPSERSPAARRAAWVALTALVLGAGVYFRLYPVIVFPRLNAWNRAELTVYTGIRRAVAQHLARTYPHAGADEMRALRAREMERTIRAHRRNIKNSTRDTAAELLKRERGQPFYLMEADSYHYLRLTRSILESGSMARAYRGREFFNPLTLAPVGAWYPADFHPYIGAALYSVIRCLPAGASIPLEPVLGALPILLAASCAVPFLLIALYALRLRLMAYGLGLLHLLLSCKYLMRSLVGWYDTDGYNILFPLWIYLCICLWLRPDSDGPASARTPHRGPPPIFWIGAAAGVTALYSLFWRGWLIWHLILAGGALIGLTALRLTGPVRERGRGWSAWLAYLVLPVAVAPALWGLDGWTAFWAESAHFYRDFVSPSVRLWPDVFLTVGELKPAGWRGLSASVGGNLLYWASLCGLIVGALSGGRTRKGPAFAALGLFVLTSTVGASLDRLTLFIALPAALGTALFIESILSALSDPAGRRHPGSWRQFTAMLAAVAITAFFGIRIVRQAHLAVRYEHPIYNRAWDSLMQVIRTQTPEEALIASWWPPGHFITSMGRRKVFFDGATQNTPQAFWVAALFMETSERRSLAILRMLARGSNTALEVLLDGGLKTSEAIRLLLGNLTSEPAQALERYTAAVGPEKAARVLDASGGQVCPVYVLVYEEMASEALALEYVGNWNFAAAERLAEYAQTHPHKVSPRLLRRATKENLSLTWALSRPPYKQDAESYEDHRAGSTVYFPNGLTLDLKSGAVQLDSKKFGRGRPRSLYRVVNGEFVQTALSGADLTISVLLIEHRGPDGRTTYSSVIADGRLIESMVFRLFYLRGAGLRGYRLVAARQNTDSDKRLYLYEVDFDRAQAAG